MTTAISLIENALETIGLLPEGQSVPAWHTKRALVRLNDMLDSWATDTLYAQATTEAVVVNPTATVTLGPTGDLVYTTVPARVETAFYRWGDIDYPVSLISYQEYADIGMKSLSGPFPSVAYYDGNGTMTLYPTPSGGELHVAVASPIREFATLSTDYSLQAGARQAISLSLAEELAPSFGREVPVSVMRRAAQARKALRLLNFRVPTLARFRSSEPVWNILNPPNADIYDGGNAGSPG